jgi:hypothetical protein
MDPELDSGVPPMEEAVDEGIPNEETPDREAPAPAEASVDVDAPPSSSSSSSSSSEIGESDGSGIEDVEGDVAIVGETGAPANGGKASAPPFAVSRVRKLARWESTSKATSAESVRLIAFATKYFVEELARDAHTLAQRQAQAAAAKKAGKQGAQPQGGVKTTSVQYDHVAAAVKAAEKYQFLHDVLPPTSTAPKGQPTLFGQ